MIYWRMVIARAFQETIELLGVGNLRRVPVTVVAFILAILILRFIPGGLVQVTDEARWAVAVVLATAALFVPIFASKLITVPSAIYFDQQRTIMAVQSDDINQLVESLRSQSLKGEDGEPVEYDMLLAGEFADLLATRGVTVHEQGLYKGLTKGQLEGFLASMTYLGIVEARRRTVEADRGYPYTETDYFVTQRGAEVIRRIHKKWEKEYPPP